MAVDEKTREALDLKQLSLPKNLPVVSIDVEEYVDSYGEDALRIWVVLPEDFDPLKIDGDDVIALKSAIDRSLLDRQVTLFPYIHLVKASELEEMREQD
jgi:hypothetical protein